MILLRQQSFSTEAKIDSRNYLPLYKDEKGYRWRKENDPLYTEEDETRPKNAKKPDITSSNGIDLVLSKKAYRNFKKDLDKNKFRKEKIDGKTYYVADDLVVDPEDIDEEKSDIKRFKDGRIMRVSNPVLKSDKSIYRSPGAGHFVNDKFKDRYNKKKLSGLRFKD